MTELVHKLITDSEELLLKTILTEFAQLGFMYSDNWEAVVNDVHIISASILEVNIIDADDDEAQASVSIQIEFTASITGPDYDNGIWDSEDKAYAYVPDFSLEHTFCELYEVTVEFSFTPDKVESIKSIIFEDGRDITLSIDDGYPYK